MNADLEHLIVLQAQDLELWRLRNELAEAPRRVADAKIVLQQAETALAAAKAALAKEEVLRRSQESDVAGHKAKIARLRKQLDSATSTAQVTAYEHEIGFAEQAIATLEDAELESMERTEQQEAAQVHGLSSVEHAKAALERTTATAAELTTHNTEQIAGIERERTALRAQITESVLSMYDRIAKAKGTGVSEGVDHKCSACQMMVRPQRWNDLTGKDFEDTLFTCETCGRLLYYDPRRDAPVKFEPGSRLDAARAGAPEVRKAS